MQETITRGADILKWGDKARCFFLKRGENISVPRSENNKLAFMPFLQKKNQPKYSWQLFCKLIIYSSIQPLPHSWLLLCYVLEEQVGLFLSPSISQESIFRFPLVHYRAMQDALITPVAECTSTINAHVFTEMCEALGTSTSMGCALLPPYRFSGHG